MSRVNYEAKLDSFVSNNVDLIGEYESLENALPIEYCTVEVLDSCQKLLKIDKSLDFNKAMRDAFSNAIRYNINVIDSFESLISGAVTESMSSMKKVRSHIKTGAFRITSSQICLKASPLTVS